MAGQDLDGAVYWLERSGSRRGLDRVTLAASPIDVGQTLRQVLFQSEMIRSVVMTSATLATGNDDNFRFFARASDSAVGFRYESEVPLTTLNKPS